jgi:type I restriction enzyme, S subunit
VTSRTENLVASGLPWLPQVPAHWDIARLKYVARLGTGHTPSRRAPEYWEDCTIPWLTLADVWQLRDGRKQVVDETAEKISELGLMNSAAVLHPAGTVFLSRTASVGFSGIMGVDMATSQDFVTWTCGERLRPRFLLYVLRAMKQEFKRLVMGSTHKTIYMPDVERISVPLPPLDEQEAMVAALDNEMHEMDELAELLQRQSGLLDERRSVLVLNAIGGGRTQAR